MYRFSLLVMLLSLFSCNQGIETENAFDLGYDYFPILSKGTVYTYSVAITIYGNEGKDIKNLSFFQREDIIESSKDERGRGFFRKDIFQSKTRKEPWLYIGSTSFEVNDLQVIENNLYDDRIINVSFPVAEKKQWDGLALIGDSKMKDINGEKIDFYSNWDFEIVEVGAPYDVYDDVITISQADHENALQKRNSVEIYAKGIGLVSKEQWILDTQCLDDCAGQNWEKKVHNGIILKMNLVELK
ncbi:MAG: hypothetical protein V3V00_14205 [Saprospiraceae bacterium]